MARSRTRGCVTRPPSLFSPVFLAGLTLPLALLLGPARLAVGGDDYVDLGGIPLDGIDPVSSNPYGLAFHPELPRVYVALAGLVAFPPDPPSDFNGRTVVEIEMGSGEPLRTFDVGYFPTDLAVSPGGAFLYGVASTAGTLFRVDLQSETVVSVPIEDTAGVPVSFPSSLLLSPDGLEVWVTSNGGNFDGSDENLVRFDAATLAFIDTVEIAGGLGRLAARADGRVVVPVGYPENDFTAPPEVRIFDSQTGWSAVGTVVLSVDTADFPAPIDVVLSPAGDRAYVTVFGGSDEVFVLDVDAMTLAEAWPLGGGDLSTHGVGLDPEGERLFVSRFDSSDVVVVDTATGQVGTSLPTGAIPNAVEVRGGRVWITEQFEIALRAHALPGAFIRGDTSGDGAVDITDPIVLLDHLFSGGALPCPESGDFEANGVLDLADAVLLLDHLFGGGAPPVYPYPGPGRSLGGGSLPCD